MITTITAFRMSEPLTRDQAKKLFLSTAPTYQTVPGLIRKTYTLSDDGLTAGGVYLWKTRADAEALYTDAWRAFVREKYQTEPVVTYFESPVIVDNMTGEIQSD